MTYWVSVQRTAKLDMLEACRWISRHSPAAANKWLDKTWKEIQTLESNPQRCALAPETESFSQPIRQLLVGRRRGVYRVLFQIKDDEVLVLHVRHGARQPLEQWDTEGADERDC